MKRTKSHCVKVGDYLYLYLGVSGKLVRFKVSKITPSGLIKCGHYTLNADLRVRGANQSYRATRAFVETDELRDQWTCARFAHKIGAMADKIKDMAHRTASFAVLQKADQLLSDAIGAFGSTYDCAMKDEW